MTRPHLLFYIQHLLGIGHLVRGARIAAAASAAFEVSVVLGGERPAGVDFGAARVLQLPPVKAGPAGFSALVTADGRPLDDALKRERRDRLLALFEAARPDVLLIETFPFGRRQMRFELLPLLEAARQARPRPLIAASIRDILQESRAPGRDVEVVGLVRASFDRVLVHGDARLVPLDDSFPRAAEIADRILYTGLVGPPEGQAADGAPFDVIVSVGGGAVGAELIRAALAARAQGPLADAAWLVLTGPNRPDDLAPAPEPGVTVRTFASDLPARLRGARLSLSQCGYNTVADLLAAPACRAVVVPYVGAGETEQTRRAALLEKAGLAVSVPPEELTPGRLADAMRRTLALPPAGLAVCRDGAVRTGLLLRDALRAHRLA